MADLSRNFIRFSPVEPSGGSMLRDTLLAIVIATLIMVNVGLIKEAFDDNFQPNRGTITASSTSSQSAALGSSAGQATGILPSTGSGSAPGSASAPGGAPSGGGSGTATVPGCISSCQGVANGPYSSCTSCRQFVSCSNNLLFIFDCPANLFWDDDKKRCEFICNN